MEYDGIPKEVKPLHYDLFLYDIGLTTSSKTYHGQVDIDVLVEAPVSTIVLHAQLLSIDKASIVSAEDPPIHATGIALDQKTERCHLHFPQRFPPSPQPITLRISFRGEIDERLAGFFRFKDPILAASEFKQEYTCSTQFQPSDARRAFPCFDEPQLKATFELSLQIPEGLMAISNMPIAMSRPDSTKPGSKFVRFERTPKMSTYLLAWSIGGYEYLEATISRTHNGEPLPIRVYTPPGSKESARFALDLACKVIPWFSEIFGSDYPLKKLDLLGVAEMSDDAMENWGLVTFTNNTLLCDLDSADLDSIITTTYVLAHELAHQWFGNLVTMTWWDSLWLNEGFATWAGFAACEKFYPQWDIWGHFIAKDTQQAFKLDSLASSHPIQVHVPDDLEVDSIFDSISYLKSAAVIRMLACYVGEDVFLEGVKHYLKAHAYGSATAEDLWRSVSESSGQDIATLIDPWIKTMGYPVVDAEEFSKTGMVRQDAASLNRPVPFNVPFVVQSEQSTKRALLTTSPLTIETDGRPLVVNSGYTGFFRTRYSASQLHSIARRISEIAPHDRIGILNDAMALAWGGTGAPTESVLSLIRSFSQSKDMNTWTAINAVFSQLNCTFANAADVRDGLDALARKVAEPLADELGWSFGPEEDHKTSQLRALLIPLAGLAHSKPVVEEACRRFHKWRLGDKEAVHPFLRPAMLGIAAQSLGAEAVDALWQAYTDPNARDEQDTIAEAMAQIQDPSLAIDCLRRAFQGTMTAQNCQALAADMAENSTLHEALWAFFEEEWALVVDKLGGSMAMFDPLIRQTISRFATRELQAKVEVFFAEKDTTGYTRGLSVAKEFIAKNAAYRERDLENVRAWLRDNEYARA